jgi:hypothetical protein
MASVNVQASHQPRDAAHLLNGLGGRVVGAETSAFIILPIIAASMCRVFCAARSGQHHASSEAAAPNGPNALGRSAGAAMAVSAQTLRVPPTKQLP